MDGRTGPRTAIACVVSLALRCPTNTAESRPYRTARDCSPPLSATPLPSRTERSARVGAPLGPSSTEYRVTRTAGSRLTSVPSMCVAVRVYRSTATVSVPRRAISVVGATGASAGIAVQPDEQATTKDSAASAAAATRGGDTANMLISGRVRVHRRVYGSALRGPAHGQVAQRLPPPALSSPMVGPDTAGRSRWR